MSEPGMMNLGERLKSWLPWTKGGAPPPEHRAAEDEAAAEEAETRRRQALLRETYEHVQAQEAEMRAAADRIRTEVEVLRRAR